MWGSYFLNPFWWYIWWALVVLALLYGGFAWVWDRILVRYEDHMVRRERDKLIEELGDVGFRARREAFTKMLFRGYTAGNDVLITGRPLTRWENRARKSYPMRVIQDDQCPPNTFYTADLMAWWRWEYHREVERDRT